MNEVAVTEKTLDIMNQLAAHIKATGDKKAIQDGEEMENTVAEYLAVSPNVFAQVKSLNSIVGVGQKGMVIKWMSFDDSLIVFNTIEFLEVSIAEMGYPVQYEGII
ncbi:hypothetical protein COPG_00100 [Colwellia phage 9A]|uniref:Uncharacterized protein n=1 Tax=Colwellia phage 9A TaxID=765765 RepID=I3UMI1_9CAUD|nr:hypothetical protein COPG_00100 [Colwellia phage 9A]AFK66696.1 hypothetical protein COPG_00100 [Colwellia phage 9A]